MQTLYRIIGLEETADALLLTIENYPSRVTVDKEYAKLVRVGHTLIWDPHDPIFHLSIALTSPENYMEKTSDTIH